MVATSGQSPNSNARFYLGINGGYWDIGIATSAWATSSPAAAVIDQWDHLVVTMDGSSARLYVNGVLIRTKVYSSYTLNRNIYIGVHDNNYWFSGSVDDVRIYNTALSADDILSIYNEK